MRVATPTSLQIRQRRRADDPFIVRLAAQAFAEYDGQPALTMRATRSARDHLGRLARGYAARLRLVHPLNQASVDLCAIAVEEDARGLGIGRALLAHVELAAVSAGQSEIRLHTAQSNLSALRALSQVRLSRGTPHAALLPWRVRRMRRCARSWARAGARRDSAILAHRLRAPSPRDQHCTRTVLSRRNASTLSHEISTARYLSERSAHSRLGTARGRTSAPSALTSVPSAAPRPVAVARRS